MYEPIKVNVVDRARLKKKLSSSSSGTFGIKINLKNTDGGGEDTLLLTRGQIAKMERARLIGKSAITIPLSSKQMKVNKRHEGGFIATLIAAISAIASAAAAAAPEIVAGVATGVATGLIDKAVSGGNGLYLYRRGQYARIRPVKGGGLYLTPHAPPPPPPPPSGNGLFLKFGEDIYTHEEISHSPWMKSEVPLLDIIL